MDKNECEDIYSETETEEHLNGKRDLFEWIKKQPCITDAVLEGWIAETKQRPDIMFKFNGKQYVIEYQCSPIATEWIERHELYQAAGIMDIWILGTEKYLKPNMREKFIQEKSVGFYDTTNKSLILLSYGNIVCFDLSKSSIKFKVYRHNNAVFYGSKLDNFVFQNEIIHKEIGNIELATLKHKKRCKSKFEDSKINSDNYTQKVEKIINGVNKSLGEKKSHLLNRYDMKSTNGYNNIYLNANDLIRVILLNNIITSFNGCDNWAISIVHNRGVYNLCACPIIRKFCKPEIFETKELNSYNLISYCNDIVYLKNDILELMKTNFIIALNYKDKNVRILEVQ